MASAEWPQPCRNKFCNEQMDCLTDRYGYSELCYSCGHTAQLGSAQCSLEELNERRKERAEALEDPEPEPLEALPDYEVPS